MATQPLSTPRARRTQSLESVVRELKESYEEHVSRCRQAAVDVNTRTSDGKRRHQKLMRSVQDYQLMVDALEHALFRWENQDA